MCILNLFFKVNYWSLCWFSRIIITLLILNILLIFLIKLRKISKSDISNFYKILIFLCFFIFPNLESCFNSSKLSWVELIGLVLNFHLNAAKGSYGLIASLFKSKCFACSYSGFIFGINTSNIFFFSSFLAS